MKKLNTDSITNELVHSSFFPGRPTQKPEAEAHTAPAPQPAPVKQIETVRTKPAPVKSVTVAKPVPAAVPSSAPAGRQYVRRTFDFYEDQIAYLTKASLENRLAGKEGSMNAMVREAIDAYIHARKEK